MVEDQCTSSSSIRMEDGSSENPSSSTPTARGRLSVFGDIAAGAALDDGDIENQNPQAAAAEADANDSSVYDNDAVGDFDIGGSGTSFTRASKMKRASMNAKIGILALMDDEVDDNGNKDTKSSTTTAAVVTTSAANAPRRAYIPFPSIDELSMHNNKWDDDDIDFANITTANKRHLCPCRCFFFTLMEATCLVMSALGCAVFFAGLVALCLFLEGSYVNGDQ